MSSFQVILLIILFYGYAIASIARFCMLTDDQEIKSFGDFKAKLRKKDIVLAPMMVVLAVAMFLFMCIVELTERMFK